ncbi:hypothetical protein ACFL0W_03020 [Nanoarchaeota archaeon]
MNRKKIDSTKYIAVFAMTTLIFIAGILIGNHLNNIKIDQVTELEQRIRSDSMGTELEFLIRTEEPCRAVNSTRFTAELGEIGQKLTFMESELSSQDLRVKNLKAYYSLLEIRHWLFLKKFKDECNGTYGLVLYFYSNEGDCGNCEDQGHVLSYVHNKDPSFNIYSFDINIQNPALRALKDIYGVRKAPSIIIGEDSYTGFRSREELIELLELNMSLFE